MNENETKNDNDTPASDDRENRPTVTFTGQDGNIFNLAAITRRALIDAGQQEKAKTVLQAISKAESYQEALEILGRYVDFD